MTLQEVTLTIGEQQFTMADTFKNLEITFKTDLLQLRKDEDESNTLTLSVSPVSDAGYLTPWTEGRLAVGGLLGENKQQWSFFILSAMSKYLTVHVGNLIFGFIEKPTFKK